jgi:hypothetical protein
MKIEILTQHAGSVHKDSLYWIPRVWGGTASSPCPGPTGDHNHRFPPGYLRPVSLIHRAYDAVYRSSAHRRHLIQWSAWKGSSPKLNFRFTKVSEVAPALLSLHTSFVS